MKKFLSLILIFAFSLCCACAQKEVSDTVFMLNTVVSIKANTDEKTLEGAFDLCRAQEDIFSRTQKDSELYKINGTSEEQAVSPELLSVIKKAVYFGDISDGLFDVTVCPVSSLWDFTGDTLPSDADISAQLDKVNYKDITVEGDKVNLNGKSVDLGGIAKGYIADKIKAYFEKNGVKEAIIDLGGSITLMGKEKTVAIQKPFSPDSYAGYIKTGNKSIVTSGVYQRYIEKNGRIYHHILDPKTGYAVQTDLYSATVISSDATSADALATVCILKGLDGAKRLIESTENTEAVFIDKNGKLYHTSGLIMDKKTFKLKN